MSDGSQQLQRRALQDGKKQGSMFAVAIPFIIITTIVMGLRLHVRSRLVQGGLGLDDRKQLSTQNSDTQADMERSSACRLHFHDRAVNSHHDMWLVWSRHPWYCTLNGLLDLQN